MLIFGGVLIKWDILGCNLLTNRYPPVWRVKKGPWSLCLWVYLNSCLNIHPRNWTISPWKICWDWKTIFLLKCSLFRWHSVIFREGGISISFQYSPGIHRAGWFLLLGKFETAFLLKMLKGDFDVTLDWCFHQLHRRIPKDQQIQMHSLKLTLRHLPGGRCKGAFKRRFSILEQKAIRDSGANSSFQGGYPRNSTWPTLVYKYVGVYKFHDMFLLVLVRVYHHAKGSFTNFHGMNPNIIILHAWKQTYPLKRDYFSRQYILQLPTIDFNTVLPEVSIKGVEELKKKHQLSHVEKKTRILIGVLPGSLCHGLL